MAEEAKPAPTGPVLAVFAHPDDAEICAGGVLTKWAVMGPEILTSTPLPCAASRPLQRRRRPRSSCICPTLTWPFADEVVCLRLPPRFRAVGLHYDDFTPTTDTEVLSCLGHAGSSAAPVAAGIEGGKR